MVTSIFLRGLYGYIWVNIKDHRKGVRGACLFNDANTRKLRDSVVMYEFCPCCNRSSLPAPRCDDCCHSLLLPHKHSGSLHRYDLKPLLKEAWFIKTFTTLLEFQPGHPDPGIMDKEQVCLWIGIYD